MNYNGYANYETWVWSLWQDNDQHQSSYVQSLAEDAWTEAEPTSYSTREEEAASNLADRLKSEAEESMPEVEGVWADLLNAAFGEIDWYEIAEGLIAEVDKTEDVEAE